MDISNLHANSVSDRRVKGGQASPAEGSSSATSGQNKTGADEVQLSGQARALQQLADAVAEQPAFDAQRVVAIRDAIAEGRYHVDPERLAENFIDLEYALNQ
jgi:negative regulator of flagellin synthesis FlgM